MSFERTEKDALCQATEKYCINSLEKLKVIQICWSQSSNSSGEASVNILGAIWGKKRLMTLLIHIVQGSLSFFLHNESVRISSSFSPLSS